jgi:uncharacterized protein
VICPKCQNTMRTVDRQGVHLDQCEGCRGIFLDRGELESILSAEDRYVAAAAPPPYQPEAARGHYPDSPHGHRGGYPDSPHGHRGGYPDSPKGHRGGYPDSPRGFGHGAGYGSGHGGRRNKRRSFLEELFD